MFDHVILEARYEGLLKADEVTEINLPHHSVAGLLHILEFNSHYRNGNIHLIPCTALQEPRAQTCHSRTNEGEPAFHVGSWCVIRNKENRNAMAKSGWKLSVKKYQELFFCLMNEIRIAQTRNRLRCEYGMLDSLMCRVCLNPAARNSYEILLGK
ncbi:hypothetical protein J6590_024175 [Homalodisca vitripennis]|nr:hypothetical protein J6590_024175 [Homalodisca vitripennis]